MSDLVEKVAKIIDLDDCTATERAKAAIVVVLREMMGQYTVMASFIRAYARENGVSLDE